MSALTERNFSPAGTHQILNQACAEIGIEPLVVTLVRHQTNAVYLIELPDRARLIVKIARPAESRTSVERTLRLIDWIGGQGLATVHPTGHFQPVAVGGCLVTFWPYLDQGGLRPVTAAELAEPLAVLHSLRPPFPLPRLEAVSAIRHSIATSPILSPAEAALLRKRCDALSAALPCLPYVLEPGLIHADPQHRNALRADTGQVLLIDWDSACIGQPEWDLVTIEIHTRRFTGDHADYQAFCTAYGIDIRTWAGFNTLRNLRELRMITTNARKSTPGSPAADEVHRRIAGLETGDDDAPWRRL
ncbi:phosphotransferase enzyme family protein [Longispora fulva]|nr:phosphotransferase [Longispora fulva]